MKTDLPEIERLDLVAASKATTAIISVVRIFLLFFTPFAIFLAAYSKAPFRETVIVSVGAIASLLTTGILWVNWRYKVYALAALCFVWATGAVVSLDHPPSHTILSWIGARSYLLLFFLLGSPFVDSCQTICSS